MRTQSNISLTPARVFHLRGMALVRGRHVSERWTVCKGTKFPQLKALFTQHLSVHQFIPTDLLLQMSAKCSANTQL